MARSTVRVSDDDAGTLGRGRWTDRFGLPGELVAAVIDGLAWESPFNPLP